MQHQKAVLHPSCALPIKQQEASSSLLTPSAPALKLQALERHWMALALFCWALMSPEHQHVPAVGAYQWQVLSLGLLHFVHELLTATGQCVIFHAWRRITASSMLQQTFNAIQSNSSLDGSNIPPLQSVASPRGRPEPRMASLGSKLCFWEVENPL